jgi:hypothetical protein
VAETHSSVRDRAASLADLLARELVRRFSFGAGIFPSFGASRRPVRWLHRNLSTFATQVYPMHGLAAHARLGGDHAAVLRRAAETLCYRQGALGQWWWFYDARDGSVVEGYPVYSVHQDAMALMALAPLRDLGIGDWRGPMARGLDWMFGRNELASPMFTAAPAFVSRCIQRNGSDADGYAGIPPASRLRLVASSNRLCPPPGSDASADGLERLDEARSYHLGWLLYARSLVGSSSSP